MSKQKTSYNFPHLAVYTVMAICLLPLSSALSYISWDHWSSINIHEEITSLGNGEYNYKYSFVNTDASPIWHFLMYTDYSFWNHTVFSQRADWDLSGSPVGGGGSFDARNLDPDIRYMIYVYTYPFMDQAKSIQTGEYVSGFSFNASVYDPSPKYFAYETLASGHATSNGTGKVAAVGLTPEPCTLLLLGLGAAILRKRK
jgi:hypothetical protein